MTSPADPFNDDFNKLQQDAEAFNQAQQEAAAQEAAYTEAFNNAFKSGNPELVFIALIMAFSNQGFSELDGGWAVNGDALAVQGDLTKLGNDIQNLTQPTANDPTASTPADLIAVTKHLDMMLDALNDHNAPASGSGDWYKYLQNAIGSTGGSALAQQYAAMRSDIYYKEDDADHQMYNPAACPTPGTTRTYHFDPDAPAAGPGVNPSTNYISSFADLEKYMAMQGDPGQANEASKLWTDAQNTNEATTQSVQSSTNELISSDANTIKTFQSFVTNMMQALLDVTKGTIQNQARA